MKINCVCGQMIPDNTDCIPYKAYVIADMDLEAYDDAVRQKDMDAWANYTKNIYQCTQCGRLYLEISGSRHFRIFTPETLGPVQHSILRSIEGDHWKRPLVGTWRSTRGDMPGELWWGFGVADEGFETFDNWDVLEFKYFEVFERLHGQGYLSSAALSKEGKRMHQWPARKKFW